QGGGPTPEQVSRWVSVRPIPLAGFDLGKYEKVTAKAGDVTVETYATSGVERGFPRPKVQNVIPDASMPDVSEPQVAVLPPLPPPARNAQAVTAQAAQAIDSFSRWYGPYPYSDLKLAQIPGVLSQGWPSLVFLSSISFLTPKEKSELHASAVESTL